MQQSSWKQINGENENKVFFPERGQIGLINNVFSQETYQTSLTKHGKILNHVPRDRSTSR
jgi:hypothetical protein